ncbi:glycoside hydrolase family 38 C-terminal domain-containing protein [Liquorilactobacillus vini]|uniref:glycoside hydrolase family 38 C-terminal domain-containing protein n=1 Tax=Liquorilactobacillus vini TaxID=238015 RepID=UPI0009DB470A
MNKDNFTETYGQKKILKETSVINGENILTPFYNIKISSSGSIKEIYDHINKREVFDTKLGGNLLWIYEDRPLDFDNWNIDKDYIHKGTQLKAGSYQLLENNSLFTSFEFVYSFRNSKIKQIVLFYSFSPRIDFKTYVDWHEHQTLLRTEFNTNINSSYARFDIQYGNILRSTSNNTTWEQAEFETVGHKWADLSDLGYGVSLLNDCKYGYKIKDKKVSLTLIKSGIYPDINADQGQHSFVYSLLPHNGDFVDGDVEKNGWELNDQLQLEKYQLIYKAGPLFNFTARYPVAVDAIKLSEDKKGIILRLNEYSGRLTKIAIKVNFACKSKVQLTNLEEKFIKNISIENNVLSIDVEPYKIVTLKFEL